MTNQALSQCLEPRRYYSFLYLKVLCEASGFSGNDTGSFNSIAEGQG